MRVGLAWNAAVAGWRALAARPTADGVFAWERRGDTNCLWWTGTPGRMSHQLFLTTPTRAALRQALESPQWPAGSAAVARGVDTAEFAAVLDGQQSSSGPLMLHELSDEDGQDDHNRAEFATALVETAEQRAASLRLLAAIYGDPGGLTAFFQGPGAAEVVGVYADGRLIASATLVSVGSTVCLWSVATAEDARGRGAASTAIRTALRHARARGHSMVTLGTTDELVPWYERFGFVQVGRERTATVPTS